MNRQMLLDAGYRHFNQRKVKEYTNSFYQKRFDDSKGKKYYITIAEYDNNALQFKDVAGKDFSYNPEMQFTVNGIVFDVDIHVSEKSIEEIEHFVDTLWLTMRCDYYELW